MHRREFLKRSSAGAAALGVSAVAGCPGDEAANADGDVTNEVDELAVEDTTVEEDLGGTFELEADVTNTGDRTVDLSEHTMELTVFGEGGENLTDRGRVEYPNRSSEPGETRDVLLVTEVSTDAQDVVRWELRVYCDSFDDGGYCA